MQFREELEGTEPILVIDDPDSTIGGTKKKKKKASRRIEDSDKESNASEVLSWSQRPRAKRQHISSKRSSVQGYDVLSPKGKDSKEESGDEMKNLLLECDDVEERLAKMQRKMEGLEWSEKAWQYRVTIEEYVVHFRVCLINNYGHKEESEDLLNARVGLEQNMTMLQQNGLTLTVCEDFVDRVEKTIRSGFIPEQRFTMKVTENSADDPVQGYMCDVTYCLEIPMVVKWEKAEDDDDLEIVRVTPATKTIVDVVKVKTEEKTPPSSPQKGAGTEPQKSTPPQKGAGSQPQKSMPPNKNMTGDNDSSPKKNTTETEDKSMAHDEDNDMTEDNAVCPLKLSTPQKVKPKGQKTLGTMISRKLRSHRK